MKFHRTRAPTENNNREDPAKEERTRAHDLRAKGLHHHHHRHHHHHHHHHHDDDDDQHLCFARTQGSSNQGSCADICACTQEADDGDEDVEEEEEEEAGLTDYEVKACCSNESSL